MSSLLGPTSANIFLRVHEIIWLEKYPPEIIPVSMTIFSFFKISIKLKNSKITLINQNKRIIFAGDFSIFFTSKLEARGGKPIPKRKSIIKLVDIKESLDICDVWRIRNPKRQNFTFRQSHSTRFIERRLDYIFISNFLQEFVNRPFSR